jgi:FkbH-like protein
MTVATRRLTAAELDAWASAVDHTMLTFRVSDRFGDSGLTGMVGLRFAGDVAHVVDFLWSCRVAGRSVEAAMLHVAVAHSRAHGASTLRVEIGTTARNKPCVEFFERSGLRRLDDTVYVWDAAQPYECPPWVTLTDQAGAATTIDSRWR